MGLFGGSFDPVHNAHLALARAALLHLQLDELRFIPAGRPWQKTTELASAADRAAMVSLAIAGEPRFVLEACELARPGPSYTLDTVRELRARADADPKADWFLVIGQDQYARLHTWHGWQQLLRLVTLAVANRPGAPVSASPQLPGHAYQAVALPMMDISSSDIRSRVAAGGPIAQLVPPGVARYIDQHRLYQGTPRS